MRIEGEGVSAIDWGSKGLGVNSSSETPWTPDKILGNATKESQASGITGKQGSGGKDSLEISPEAQREAEKLKETDRRVKAHEQAHMAAGAGLVRGGAQYSYQRGPDGQMYAVAGEVTLDTSPVPNSPEATLTKAQRIRAAALAPADPSPQDQKVAAQAGTMEAKAASELAQQKKGELQKVQDTQARQSNQPREVLNGTLLGGLLNITV